jgi:hypothetical protein
VSPVCTPVATGRMLTVPYYAGYQYVAFLARSVQEVSILNNEYSDNKIIHKVGRVELYERKPDSFAYYAHCFHVLKVF